MRLLADDDEAKAKERGELLEKLARANASDEKTKRKDPKKVDLHYIEDQLKEDPGELPRKAAQRLQQALTFQCQKCSNCCQCATCAR